MPQKIAPAPVFGICAPFCARRNAGNVSRVFLSAFRGRCALHRAFFTGQCGLDALPAVFRGWRICFMALCAGKYRFRCCEKSLDIVSWGSFRRMEK